MTVKLLTDWKDSATGKQYKAGNLVTLDAGTEAGLVAEKLADSNTTGGTAWVAPVVPESVDETKVAAFARDASGQVTGLVGPDGKLVKLGGTSRRKSAILRRPNSFIANGNGTGNNVTESLKFEVPFQFTWVRLWIMAKSAAAPVVSTAFKAIVAPTETFADDTDTNRYTPIIGGQSRNALATSNTPGWVSVTWNGAATVQTPQVVFTNNHYDAFAASDRIMVNSIPRTDGGSGSLLMVKINMPADSGGYNIINDGITLHNSTFPTERIQRAQKLGADGVSNPALIPTGTAYANQMLNVWVEFGTQAEVGTFLSFGDSISTYSLTLNNAGMDTWIAKAAYEALPGVGYVSNACGSTNAAEWWGEFNYFFEKEVNNSTKYLLLPVMTPNFSFDATNIRATLEVVDKILDVCADKGIKVFLWTPYYFPSQNDANQAVAINWAKAAAAAGRCVLVDINAAIPSGTAHLKADNIHPNTVGTTIMYQTLKAALAANA